MVKKTINKKIDTDKQNCWFPNCGSCVGQFRLLNKYYRLKNRNLFLTALEARRSKMKAPAALVVSPHGREVKKLLSLLIRALTPS